MPFVRIECGPPVHRIPHGLYGLNQRGFERLLRGPAHPVGRKPQVPTCGQIHCFVTHEISEVITGNGSLSGPSK